MKLKKVLAASVMSMTFLINGCNKDEVKSSSICYLSTVTVTGSLGEETGVLN